jgi:hypothetical protein
MSSVSDSEVISGQLFVTNAESKPKALGTGSNRVDGSTYMQGPTQVGNDGSFSDIKATLMVGPLQNSDCGSAPHSVYIKGSGQYPLYVEGNAYFAHPNIGDLSDRFNVADSRPKPFDMVHPSREDWRLRYACIEGPEVGVYYRGRVKNKTEIDLPWYWKDVVHTESISVQLQPVGSHQDVIVKRWDSEKIYLQAKGGMPIDCFYHIYAERKDVNGLVVEYEGSSWKDYPDPTYQDSNYSYKINTPTLDTDS